MIQLKKIIDGITNIDKALCGMALGLSVDKVMTKLHGGHNRAKSVEGQRSNFSNLAPVKPGLADAANRVLGT